MPVNVGSAAALTSALLPALRDARGHVIVLLSSADLRGVPGWSAYLASKAALHQLAATLRNEEPEVRVTTVLPGAVATDLLREVREGFSRPFDPATCMSADGAARLILSVLEHPDDAYLTEIHLVRA